MADTSRRIRVFIVILTGMLLLSMSWLAVLYGYAPSHFRISHWTTVYHKHSVQVVDDTDFDDQPSPTARSTSTNRRKYRHAVNSLPQVDPNGYVAYLPHSGVNNQKEELENALLVAYILNRTLIIPPLYLGHTRILSWSPFETLKNSIRHLETTNFNRLFFSSKVEPYYSEYMLPNATAAVVPWGFFVDLSRVPVRTICVADFVDLRVFKSKEDLVEIADGERYAYSIVDRLPGGDQFLMDNMSNDLPLSVSEESLQQPNSEQWFLVNMTLCREDDHKYSVFTDSGFYWRSGDGDTTQQRNVVSKKVSLPRLPSSFTNANVTLYSCPDTTNLTQSIQPIPWTKRTAVFDTGRSKVAQVSLNKYGHMLNLQAGVPKYHGQSKAPVLLHFGSMFGYTRVHTFHKSNDRIMENIRDGLALTNTRLLRIAEDISNAITSRAGKYLSIHLRTSDGRFQDSADDTLAFMQEKVEELMAPDPETGVANYTIIYLATDIESPRQDVRLRKFFETYRVRVLTDFRNELLQLDGLNEDRLAHLAPESLTSSWESEMTLLFDQVDYAKGNAGKRGNARHEESLKEFLTSHKQEAFKLSRPSNSKKSVINQLSMFARLTIPFVEQLVCSKGRAVVGTTGSTFSAYIERMHGQYWRGLGEEARFYYA